MYQQLTKSLYIKIQEKSNYACIFLILFSFFIVTNTHANNHQKNNENRHSTNLYKALGEKAGIEKLVDAFVLRIAKDKQIISYFAKSNVDHFKQGFVQHTCELVGGPCSYQGDNMIDIHTGMNINEADFNRVVELLILASEDVGISYRTQNKLIAKLVPTRTNIIKR